MFYHDPIQIKNLSFTLTHKICFENFSAQIHCGDRIAIIGRNGMGKSILLKAIQNKIELLEGEIFLPEDLEIGYVQQTLENFETFSGGQRFNKNFTEALKVSPNILLLDEPTNHLDLRNRKSLMRMLKNYSGTLIIVSHDVELLRCCADKLWHIDAGEIKIFSGNYDHYLNESKLKRGSIEKELEKLKQEKNSTHHTLMQEQERSKKSKSLGEKKRAQCKWSKLTAGAKKRQAQETTGNKKKEISNRKQQLMEELSNLRLPEIIKPKFSLTAKDVGRKNILSINDGAIGYKKIILKNIFLSLMSNECIAISGDNGSGKSTLIKGILCEPGLTRTGDWNILKRESIGYLDQHYANLDSTKNVFQTIAELVPSWSQQEIRKHLNDFLFRKEEEINASIKILSGGEKARLSLAKIAVHTPQLLILDEITNNIDLETRAHVIQVLQSYPGAMIIISHDEDFLEKLNISNIYKI